MDYYFLIFGGVALIFFTAIFLVLNKRKKTKSHDEVHLTRLSISFKDRILSIFSKENWRDTFFEELRTIFLESDAGPEFTEYLLKNLNGKIKHDQLDSKEEIIESLREILLGILSEAEAGNDIWSSEKQVVLILGVNGVGKTTSIGKLAHYLKKQGKQVLLSAADTYRAAADEQLKVWGKRAGVRVISQNPGADPGAVVFDSIESFKSRQEDILLVDTAGRLHNKDNLIRQLQKIFRVIDKAWGNKPEHIILVIDANTGQNALQQARVFFENFQVSGIILSKLDGTAKGGAVLSIMHHLKIPVLYVGLGEKITDIKPFHPREFIDSFI